MSISIEKLRKELREKQVTSGLEERTDLSKSHTAELLHEILDLCLETGYNFLIYPFENKSIDLRLENYMPEYEKKIYHFTLDGDNPELEQCKQDLIAYKKGLNK